MSTHSIADNAARDAKVAREKASDLQQSKASLQTDHKPPQSIVDGIVIDLYLPSGMYTHLLNSSAGRTPEYPALNVKKDIERFKAELLRELHSFRDGAGGSPVDLEDPTTLLMKATLRKVEDLLTTIKVSLGATLFGSTLRRSIPLQMWKSGSLRTWEPRGVLLIVFMITFQCLSLFKIVPRRPMTCLGHKPVLSKQVTRVWACLVLCYIPFRLPFPKFLLKRGMVQRFQLSCMTIGMAMMGALQ